jgi:TolB-like protein/tetratricopeptide (TPR) repeat protein
VLYFDDRSPGKTVGHIANGLTEDLIDALSEIRALHVISPTGVRAYQGNVVALDTLARRLNVGTIVSGSVESSGPLFRVTVRLIDATTGQQLQSRTLEQKIDKLFTLQDTLVSDVALFLREHLGREIRLREKRSGTASVQAWEIAQRGEDAAQKGGDMIRAGDDKSAVGLLVRADSLFGRAHRLDPNWIVPIVDRGWLAYSFAFITPAFIPREWERATESGVGQPDASLVHWVLRGIEYADSALRRSSDSPEALALRGGLRYRLAIFSPNTRADTLMPLAEADLRMALSSRPDFANAWFALGDLYYQQGRFSEADRALRTAYDADAFLSEVRSVIATLFFASLHREHFDDARSWCRMGLKRFAGDPRFADCELSLLGRTGRGKEDVRRSWGLVNRVERGDSVGMLAPLWGYRRMMVAAVLARSGMEDSARAVLAQSRKDLPRHPASSDPGWDEAYVYLLLGDRDTAVKVLARRLAAEPYERGFVARSPWYRELRADPRFLALVRAGV